MTESAHRFLRTIADSLSPGRAAVLYLFPPLRRGSVECGVAVVAGEVPVHAAAAGDGAATQGDVVALQRHPVFVARYALVLKGPERGTWDYEILHEADAPLETLEAVVQGVLARYAESGEPERLSGDDLAALVNQPWWSAA